MQYGAKRLLLSALIAILLSAPVHAQDPPPQPTVDQVKLTGATVYTREDVLWLLGLRIGAPLPAAPGELAERLTRLYEREGFTAAKVAAALDGSTLTLTIDEGLFESIAVQGATPVLRSRVDSALAKAGVRAGVPFNEDTASEAVYHALEPTDGGFRLRDLDVVERAGRRVLLIDVYRRERNITITTGTNGREDLFSPVDGFAPALSFGAVAYDSSGFNHTYVGGHVSYKFAREQASYSLGVERPMLAGTGFFLGAEIHDLTASDDMWRLSTTEQTVAAAGFKNTFRDYYRRRGVQAHIGIRPRDNHEVVASWRWDRHEPLLNETDFSIFRDDYEYRANLLVPDAELHALVIGYSYDSLGLRDDSIGHRFARHLFDDLFRARRRGSRGWRIDWTSEIAGHGMGGDHEFTRHTLNARGTARITPRQSFAGRVMAGWSSGSLPPERVFALGGVGSVHAYRFKEARGSSLLLFNAEYALDISGDWRPGHSGLLRAVLFFDAGRIGEARPGSTDGWLRSVGFGLQTGGLRVEWGFKADDLGASPQVLVRMGRSF